MLALFEVSLYLGGHIWMGCPLDKSARDGFSPGGDLKLNSCGFAFTLPKDFVRTYSFLCTSQSPSRSSFNRYESSPKEDEEFDGEYYKRECAGASFNMPSLHRRTRLR